MIPNYFGILPGTLLKYMHSQIPLDEHSVSISSQNIMEVRLVMKDFCVFVLRHDLR